MTNILVTGGCGYIGSHTVLALLEKGHYVFIIDSLLNSNVKVLKKLKYILLKKDKRLLKNLKFFKGDLREKNHIEKIFIYANENKKNIEAVIHFAGLKAVGESVKNPLMYWETNVGGTINLIKVMNKYSCKNLIFSSSATIYANAGNKLLKENSIISPINPYGKTKNYVESLLEDIYNSEQGEWKFINLRYFNPIGAHYSGHIGENPIGKPNNLFPLILQVASRKLKELKVYGKDWNTRDGTCIRDYVHVLDLADGHVAAFEYLNNNKSQFINLNIGTGKGTTVLELIEIFKKVNNIDILYSFTSRREGDQEYVVADNSKILSVLNWKPKRDIEEMCRDGWKWQTLNPNGYLD
tara:strand:- start:2263 stop:3321 length:1059 start_codon:yes stop_codon:yes gene_type:complete